MQQDPSRSWVSPSPSHNLTLQQVVTRLSKRDAVDGILLIGSTGQSSMTSASDYDLVLALSDMPVPLGVALTTIDGRLADIIFCSVAQIKEVLALDAPVDDTQWIGRIVRWLAEGQIVHDRSGAIQRAQQKVQGGEWLRAKGTLDGYGAWFRVNFNLAHTRRIYASPDSTYRAAAELRMALYGDTDLLFGYWEIRGLPWEGDKAAIRYLETHDPEYLSLFQGFIREADPGAKLALYEQLAARTTAPLGALWPESLLALTFEDGPATQAAIEAGLSFWKELISDT